MARQQQDVDELYDLKNAFYAGNYQQAINEAQNLKPSSPEVATDRDFYLLRSYIVQGNYRNVQLELKNADPLLQPLKLLVDYLLPNSDKPAIVTDLDARVVKGTELTNKIFLTVAATIYYREENYEAALKVLNGSREPEHQAMSMQCLLAMDRPDLARKQLAQLQETDDDNTVSQMAQAWLNMSVGGAGAQDAHYGMLELAERLGALGAGPSALAAAAAAYRGLWEEAEQSLTEAQARAPNDPDLLLGLAVVAAHSAKPPEVFSRYITQMLETHPEHPFTRDYNSRTNEFNRVAAMYAPSEPIGAEGN